MAFDWQSFLDQYHIEYMTSGSNVSRGHVAVQCPFCGIQDHSQHMSISLEGKGWRCFRHPEHKGRKASYLVRALIHCSIEQAARIVGEAVFIPDGFAERVRASLSPPPEKNLPHPVLPAAFKPLGALPSARPFIRYLSERGIEHVHLHQRYGIGYCARGAYKGRIMFPVHMDGALMTWTARTIHPQIDLRYKTLSTNPEHWEAQECGVAYGPISDYLLWYDDLRDADADTIYLCEGPFDALKVSELGWDEGIVATCFFTASPSIAQTNLLHSLLRRYKNRYLLLDAGTLPTTLRVLSRLAGLSVKAMGLPPGVKDPGELTRDQLLKLCT